MNFFASLFGRMIVCVSVSLVGMWIARKHDVLTIRWLLVYYFVRLTILGIRMIVFGNLPPDYSGWYMHAHWMLDNGGVPGLDFLSPYYLGFNGVLALAVFCWDSPFSIGCAFAICECVGLLLLYDVIKRICDERSAKLCMLLYVISPICMMQSFVGGQDETISLFAVGLMLWTLCRTRCFFLQLCSALLGLGCSKILTLLYIQPVCIRQKSICIPIASLLIYSGVVLLGINPFNLVFGRQYGMDASGDEISRMTTTGNIWSVVPSVEPIVAHLVFASVVGLIILCCIRNSKEDRDASEDKNIVWAICPSLCFMAFNLLGVMTFAYYLIPMVPFFVWAVVSMDSRISYQNVGLMSLFCYLLLMCGKDTITIPMINCSDMFGLFCYGYNLATFLSGCCFAFWLVRAGAHVFHSPLVGMRLLLSKGGSI